MDGAADVAETSYTPFQSEPDAAPVRLIVRRVQAHARLPAGPLRHLQLSRLHHRPRRGTPWNWKPTIATTPRSRTPSETSSTASGLNHLPSGCFAANGAWLAVQVMAHNLVWYVGMRQTDPTWVEENRGPAWSSHPILIEPEQLPGPIAPASCKEGPTRKGRRSHRRYRWKENRWKENRDS